MTPWTVAYQTCPSMGFSRQEYWSGLPFPSPRDLPNPGIEPRSPKLQADTLPSEPPRKPLACRVWVFIREKAGRLDHQDLGNTEVRTLASPRFDSYKQRMNRFNLDFCSLLPQGGKGSETKQSPA